MEGLSDALKYASPNMKKKKDPAFDELKSKIIKPLKEINSKLKDYFAGMATQIEETAA